MMKNIFFMIVALLVGANAAYADSGSGSDDKTTIPMEDKSGKTDRNDVNIPEVNYNNSNGTLDITYDSSADNSYVEVADANGATVYSSPISTNGMETSYNVNIVLGYGYYVITIKNSEGDNFEGYLFPNL